MCFVKWSSVINSIYSGQENFSFQFKRNKTEWLLWGALTSSSNICAHTSGECSPVSRTDGRLQVTPKNIRLGCKYLPFDVHISLVLKSMD